MISIQPRHLPTAFASSIYNVESQFKALFYDTQRSITLSSRTPHLPCVQTDRHIHLYIPPPSLSHHICRPPSSFPPAPPTNSPRPSDAKMSLSPRPKTMTGLVLATTTMAKTIKVQIISPPNTKFHKVLRKMVFIRPRKVLAHDPRGSCVDGDVVNVQPAGFHFARRVSHVVTRIVAPFGGKRIEDRPPVLSEEEITGLRIGSKAKRKRMGRLKTVEGEER